MFAHFPHNTFTRRVFLPAWLIHVILQQDQGRLAYVCRGSSIVFYQRVRLVHDTEVKVWGACWAFVFTLFTCLLEDSKKYTWEINLPGMCAALAACRGVAYDGALNDACFINWYDTTCWYDAVMAQYSKTTFVSLLAWSPADTTYWHDLSWYSIRTRCLLAYHHLPTGTTNWYKLPAYSGSLSWNSKRVCRWVCLIHSVEHRECFRHIRVS